MSLEAKLVINDEEIIYTKWNSTIRDTLVRNSISPKKYWNTYGTIVPLSVPVKGTIQLWTSPSKIPQTVQCNPSEQTHSPHHRK